MSFFSMQVPTHMYLHVFAIHEVNLVFCLQTEKNNIWVYKKKKPGYSFIDFSIDSLVQQFNNDLLSLYEDKLDIVVALLFSH